MGLIGSVTSKGQTTIPKEVRDSLGLEQGTRIEWIVEDGKATVRPRKLRAADLAGILGVPPSGKRLAIDEFDDAIMDAVAEEWAEFERREREDRE